MSILSKIEKEVTIDENGIALFSQSALARLCGVHRKTIVESTVRVKWLKSVQVIDNKEFHAATCTDLEAIKVIEYYAFESKARNELALATYRAFASIGIRAYFQDLMGYSDRIARSESAEAYKRACKAYYDALPLDHDAQLPMVKKAAVVNKATCNYFGLEKSIKKDEMTTEMIKIRDVIDDEYVALFKIIQSTEGIKEILYKKYQQPRLTDET